MQFYRNYNFEKQYIIFFRFVKRILNVYLFINLSDVQEESWGSKLLCERRSSVLQKSCALRSYTLDHRKWSMGWWEEKNRKSKIMKRKSNENKKRTVLTHKLFYRDYFLFLCLDRNHCTNLLSDPRGILYIATKIQDQLGWFWQKKFLSLNLIINYNIVRSDNYL